jgi:XisI protein
MYHTVMHFDIKDGKIWIQQNMTDVDVGHELVNMDIKKTLFLGCSPLTNALIPAMA